MTSFYLDLILLYGEDLNKKTELRVFLPELSPWMLVLMLSCMEGKERGIHPKHHVLQVVASGEEDKSEQLTTDNGQLTIDNGYQV